MSPQDASAIAVTFIAALKLGVVLCLTGLFAFALDKVFGLDPRSDMDTFQKAAKDGNALPLALIYVAAVYFFSVVLGRFQ